MGLDNITFFLIAFCDDDGDDDDDNDFCENLVFPDNFPAHLRPHCLRSMIIIVMMMVMVMMKKMMLVIFVKILSFR